MDNNDNNPSAGSGQNNNFFSGFLLGLLVGAAIVFLLGTKKGKRIWKAISEEGIDNISNLLDKSVDLDKAEDEELDEIIEKPPNARASHFAEASRDKSERRGEFAMKEKTIEEKPRARRFFRGISRRVN